ncbi:alpha/beta hydrolase [Paenibacillus sp. GD4]|uniref:alpha/beta fold hydrolase n=1 Tax=Paenibacillus sp. GD4 TaxID=3068890 RepID=UPI0027969D5C|nr:alpha/beta hydrolase [Paenibacillus sp. GD4]MDQ1910702.1 alpha/beta hydrolase [Paenibacillus sp. GD4]
MPFANVNRTRIHYQVKGSGVPIIFIHPPMITSRMFMYQLKQLSERYQVVVFDLRGHGESSYSKESVTYGLLAEDVRELMDELGIKKAYIAGYSTGGTVALHALMNYPDRFYGGILISAMSEVSSLSMVGEIWTGLQLASLRAKRILAAALCAANADSLETFKGLYTSAIKGDIRNQRQYLRQSYVNKCTERLQEITAPMLLLYGDKDRLFHRYAQILHDGLPNSSLKFFENKRHQLPTKAYDAVNRVIREWIELVHPTARERLAQGYTVSPEKGLRDVFPPLLEELQPEQPEAELH